MSESVLTALTRRVAPAFPSVLLRRNDRCPTDADELLIDAFCVPDKDLGEFTKFLLSVIYPEFDCLSIIAHTWTSTERHYAHLLDEATLCSAWSPPDEWILTWHSPDADASLDDGLPRAA